MSITTTIPAIGAYGGTIPDRSAGQTEEQFAANVYPFLQFYNDSFITDTLAYSTAMNSFKTEANALEANVNAKEASAVAAAEIAAAAANYKGDWVAGYATTGYSLGMSVSYTDGFNYTSKINNNLATPVTKTNTAEWDWIEAIDPATKQDTLVSGTNIKTVNSNSLLGSGDITVQPTLVSGTNIKTIDGNSLLGSGNIVTINGNFSGSTKKLNHLVTSTEYLIPNYLGGYPASNVKVVTVNKALFIPFVLNEDVSVASMLASIETPASSNTFKMALYSSSNGLPDSYISGTAALSTAVAGGVSGAITTANLSKGTLYYFAFSCTSLTPTFHTVYPSLNFGVATTTTLYRPFTVLEGDQNIPDVSTVFTKKSLGNNEIMRIGIKE